MTLKQAFGLVVLLASAGGLVWFYVFLLRRSTDPSRFLAKSALTVVLLVVGGYGIARLMLAGGYIAAFGGIPATAVLGIILTIIWGGDIAGLFARPFENLFTGGGDPPDPEPFYSIARAKRQRQEFDGAVEEIHVQLERFPNDFTGLMMLAEIQAENQHNLTGARGTVERIVAANAANPRNCAIALNSLADWHLRLDRDREAALQCFERIRDTFPGHQVAMEATQRIAHLPPQEMLDQQAERRKITLTEQPRTGIRNPSEIQMERPEETTDEAVARLTGHLELHPQDRDAREELAARYAEDLREIAPAIEQLEFLLRQPGQDRGNMVRWLNTMADYHIRIAADVKSAEAALDRIMKKYPKSPAAEQAGRRRMLLGRELKGKEKSRDVGLGSYERDMGLR